jgi:DNA-binding transcriptional MocR family regulator
MSNDSSSGRVAAELERWIDAANPGSKLPSTRALVARHGVSPVTVQQALRILVGRGRIETVPGVGTFTLAVRTARVTDFEWQTAALGAAHPLLPDAPLALQSPPESSIALHSGYPDRSLLPERLVRAAIGRAARSETVLSRPPSAGLPALRSWFATELTTVGAADVAAVTARDVVITPGSQGALVTVFRALVGAGRPLLIESPTYWGAILAARQAGVDLIPVPSSASGPDPVDVDRAFTETGARAFYIQTGFASPTGTVWPADRKQRILDLARTHRAFLIEDDAAHDFAIDETPIPLAAQDRDGHVVYLRSLTKSVAPGMRVAAIIARGPARDRLFADTQAEEMYVSGVLQEAALDVVTQPAWRTHLRRLAEQLGDRRDLLIDALTNHAPQVRVETPPRGGLNLWARLPDRTDLPDLISRCSRAGLIVGSGDEWFPAEAPGRHLRLNYAGPSPERYPEAARILAECLAR